MHLGNPYPSTTLGSYSPGHAPRDSLHPSLLHQYLSRVQILILRVIWWIDSPNGALACS